MASDAQFALGQRVLAAQPFSQNRIRYTFQ